MTKRTAKPKPPPSLTAHACVVLGIDPGATSGWAVFVAGHLVECGVAKTAADRAHAIARALALAVSRQGAPTLPVVIVAEGWSAGGWKGIKQVLGMGASWGRWQEAIELAGVPEKRVVRVLTQRWRSDLRLHAKSDTGVYARARWPMLAEERYTHDTADAACVGAWGCHAAEVAAVLPRLRKSGGRKLRAGSEV